MLYNGPDSIGHSTKKYDYQIPFPRLTIFASDHPATLKKHLAVDQNTSTAFWARWLSHVCKAERRRLGNYLSLKFHILNVVCLETKNLRLKALRQYLVEKLP